MSKATGKLKPELERIATNIVDASYQVHSTFGPGLLESAYERCVVHALSMRGHSVRQQVAMPVSFMGAEIDAAYRVDLLVDAAVIVEIKAVETLLPVHRAQLITYLRISGHRLGFLINFNVPVIRLGIHRFIV
jgi:GxxExxY protein